MEVAARISLYRLKWVFSRGSGVGFTGMYMGTFPFIVVPRSPVVVSFQVIMWLNLLENVVNERGR